MSSARALLASLGAGTCLIIAGTVAMVSLSTVVAFSGLPGVRSKDRATPPALLAAASPDRGGSTRRAAGDGKPMVLAHAAKARATRTTRAPSEKRPTTPPSTRTLRPGAVAALPPRFSGPTIPAAPAVPSGGGGTAPAPAAAPAPSPTAPTRRPGPRKPGSARPAPVSEPTTGPLRGAGVAVGTTVTGIAGGVGEAVTPISPPAGAAVVETGQVAGDTVPAVTDAVSGLLDDLAGPGLP